MSSFDQSGSHSVSHYFLAELTLTCLSPIFWLRRFSQYLSLAATWYDTIADKGCENFLVPEILTPRLELFRRLAPFLAESNQRISKAVGIEVKKSSVLEGISENTLDWACGAPVFAS